MITVSVSAKQKYFGQKTHSKSAELLYTNKMVNCQNIVRLYFYRNMTSHTEKSLPVESGQRVGILSFATVEQACRAADWE